MLARLVSETGFHLRFRPVSPRAGGSAGAAMGTSVGTLVGTASRAATLVSPMPSGAGSGLSPPQAARRKANSRDTASVAMALPENPRLRAAPRFAGLRFLGADIRVVERHAPWVLDVRRTVPWNCGLGLLLVSRAGCGQRKTPPACVAEGGQMRVVR